jgi:ATP-dependent helicase HrpA
VLRYLRGIQRRLERAPENVNNDRQLQQRVEMAQQQYDTVVAALPPARHRDGDVLAVRWMLEELRVSFFAQSLGTAHPVSEQRIQRALSALRP